MNCFFLSDYHQKNLLILIIILICVFRFDIGHTQTNLGPDNVLIPNQLTVGQNDRYFLQGNSGLYYTDNLGNDWNKIQESFNNVYFHSPIKVYPNGVIYTYNNKSVYHSEDNGDSWTLINADFLENSIKDLSLIGDSILLMTETEMKFVYYDSVLSDYQIIR